MSDDFRLYCRWMVHLLKGDVMDATAKGESTEGLVTKLEGYRCLWYNTSTRPEGGFENPKSCYTCDGYNVRCDNYVARIKV